MSGLNLLSTNKNSAAFRPGYAPTGLTDTVSSAFTNVRQNYNFDAEQRLVGDPLFQRNSLIKERLGRDVTEVTGMDKKYPSPNADGRLEQLREANTLIDDVITTGRKENPSLYDGIKTTAEIRAEGQAKAQLATKNYEDVSIRNPSGISSTVGSLAGGLGGAFTDPINIATLPIGAGESKAIGIGAFSVAKGVALAATKEGLIQAAIQAANVPQVAEWQNQVGHKYGLAEAATDVGFGFLGGAGIRAGFEGIAPAFRGIRKGTAHVSSYMLDKISQAGPNLSQTVKDSFKYMSRAAYIDDSAPVPLRTQGDLKAHRAAVDKVAEDVNNYARPAPEIAAATDNILPEYDALRSAGLEDFANQARHPVTGASFVDALDDMASRPQTINSADYKSPERKAMRKQVLNDLLVEPEGGYAKGKTMEIIMGPSGAGKSSVIAKRLRQELKAVEIDSDIVKERLPEFDGGMGANAVHEESKAITSRWMKQAIANDWNIVHPIVGGNPTKVQALVDEMMSLGYTVNVRLVHIPANESLKRVINRFNSQGRLIPPSYVMGIGDGPLRSYEMLSQKEGVNVRSYFDNNVKEGQEPRIVESNDPRFAAGQKPGFELSGSGKKGRKAKGGQADQETIVDPAQANAFMEANAYRLREYRDEPMRFPEEIKPSEKFEASRAQFKKLIKDDPDLIIDLDDGSRMKLSDYANRLKEDEAVLEAITTCRVS